MGMVCGYDESFRRVTVGGVRRGWARLPWLGDFDGFSLNSLGCVGTIGYHTISTSLSLSREVMMLMLLPF